jgi:hypothetical protein
MDKPIKLTLNILGVEVKCVFVRNEHNYRAPISKAVAEKCYKAAVKTLQETETIPKGARSTTLCVEACCQWFESGRCNRSIDVCMIGTNQRTHKRQVIGLTVHCGNDPRVDVLHEHFDELSPKRPQVSNDTLRLTNEPNVIANEGYKRLENNYR